jgi:hypothetical protein
MRLVCIRSRAWGQAAVCASAKPIQWTNTFDAGGFLIGTDFFQENTKKESRKHVTEADFSLEKFLRFSSHFCSSLKKYYTENYQRKLQKVT